MYVQIIPGVIYAEGTGLLGSARKMNGAVPANSVFCHGVHVNSDVMVIHHLVTVDINDDPMAALAFWYSITGRTKVKDLRISLANGSWTAKGGRSKYLYVRQAVALYSGDTSPLVEIDLPHTAQVSQQILDKSAVRNIPHFERPIGS